MNSLMKLIGPAISLAAGFLGGKLVDKAWMGFTGQQPPKRGNKEAQAEASMRQIIGFAVLSAITAALIQVFTDRGTQKAIARFTK
ncbi:MULTISPECIES: DUF4235 domain-containing protein [Paeniglutamicibacter]|uniref:DUF4235 domain-containing protein n=1 Tax=Paeniglutamicibacter terrestris TaxID=2723403 RepID=A0ABX1FZ88_9MICC|nr:MULTISPECIES: DUF4235 domain-containing protein [Paeniglutamicibacter]ASN38491.1 hypothetical protein CGQ24_05330 [Arthrobacter sp. 7749]NKG19259.1 DUF4235 domain-containing protein [Paeniglutamicibacter terrestris]QXQ09497.1 DUF4235 domain-containing protein [Paeniglutamicibacter sp. Y32M11]